MSGRDVADLVGATVVLGLFAMALHLLVQVVGRLA